MHLALFCTAMVVQTAAPDLKRDEGIETTPSADTDEAIRFQTGDVIKDAQRRGQPATSGCPDCGGSLWQLGEGEILTFRCRVGHAHTPKVLLDAQSTNVENGLWQAARALEDGQPDSAGRLRDQADPATRQAETVRSLLTSEPAVVAIDELPEPETRSGKRTA